VFQVLTNPETITAIGAVLAAFFTAALFGVTWALAKETRRLADLSARPQIIAAIQSNRWEMAFADLHVENTGNAAAFDINVEFEPALDIEPVDEGAPPPLQHISLLRPGQSLSSSLVPYMDIIDRTYTVTVSWKRDPSADAREAITYIMRVADVRGMTHLGSADPTVQMAEDLRSIKEDFHKIATGWNKPRVDVFTSADRERERADIERQYEARRAAEVAAQSAEER
jgi:hypothetical protein